MSIANDVTRTAPVAAPSVADPAPLGLAAFAMTTLALSLSNANVWPAGIEAALALALVYGGAAQLLAGMWEFARKNTFGAIAFTSYGAFWIAYYVFIRFQAPDLTSKTLPQAVGVFLLGWTIITFYLMIASLRVNWPSSACSSHWPSPSSSSRLVALIRM